MIKKLLPFVVFYTIIFSSFAQYCGNSGSFQCVSSGLSLPWLSPHPDSLEMFVNGQPSTTVIQFKNFNTVFFAGAYYTVTSLRIDTVDNLPPGLCWASNKANNTYANQENGCLKINGVPCGPTGQYKMRIIVTVDLGFGNVQVDADQAGLKYYVRLKNSGDADVPGDSTQTAANAFIPYGGTCGTLPLNAYLGTDPTVCSGSVATLAPLITGGAGPFTYAWSGTGNTLSCNNCANPTVTLTQNSTFTVTVTDAGNATVTDTIAYTVTGAGNNFQISAAGATTVCQGATVQLNGTQGGTFNYQWLQDNTNVIGGNSLQLGATNTGNYTLLYYNNNCYATSNIIPVNVLPRPDASINAQPTTACIGDTITLSAQADTSVNYFRWQFNNVTAANTTPSYEVTASGAYKLIVKNSADCYDTASFTVTFKALPQVTQNGTADNACNAPGFTVPLTGGSPAGGVYSGAGVAGNTFSPNAAGVGTHTILYTYTDTAGCSNSATETIEVVVCGGINDNYATSTVSVYPNPAGDIAVIESELIDANSRLWVSDITGKAISVTYKAVNGKATLNTQVLQPGTYLVTLTNNGKTLTLKFMKEG